MTLRPQYVMPCAMVALSLGSAAVYVAQGDWRRFKFKVYNLLPVYYM